MDEVGVGGVWVRAPWSRWREKMEGPVIEVTTQAYT